MIPEGAKCGCGHTIEEHANRDGDPDTAGMCIAHDAPGPQCYCDEFEWDNAETAYETAVTQLAGFAKQVAHWGSSNCTPADDWITAEAARVVDAILAAVDERGEIATVQAAVVAAVNALGVTLIGSTFTPVTSSPISNDEVAVILANAKSAVKP